MVLIPGRCQRCGRSVADVPLIDIEGTVTNLEVGSAVQVAGCVYCGGDVQAIEGRMHVTDGAIEMVSGPQWSWDLVEALGLALKQVVERQPADPIAAVAETSPLFASQIELAVGRALDQSWKKPSRSRRRELAFATIGAILTLLNTDGQLVRHNAEEVKDAVADVLQYVAEHGEAPTLL